MKISNQRTTRFAIAGLLAVAGFGLTGCGGEDAGTDVEDITEGDVAESPPTAEGTDGTTEPLPPVTPYRGPYNEQFYGERHVYEGQEVTLTGEVEGVLSDQAFEISDPDEDGLEPLLVIHNLDQPPALEDGQVVEVVGTVQASFDPATAGEDMGIELDAGMLGEHQDDAWIQATEVSTDVATEGNMDEDMGEGTTTDSP